MASKPDPDLKSLIVEKDRMNAVFEDVFIPMLLINQFFDIVKANKEAIKLFNIHDNININELSVIIPELMEYFPKIYDDETVNIKLEAQINNVPVFIQATKVTKSEVLVVIQDMTKEHLLWDQLRQAQKMELMGQMASGIAHDFKNLLTVIGGYTNIVRKKLGKSPLKDYLDQIYKSVEKGSASIRNLLTFSRSSSGDYKPQDVNVIVNDVSSMAENIIIKSILINIKLYENPLMVMADSVQLEHCFLNLIANARDAMPNGGSITITTSLVSRGDLGAQNNTNVREFARIDVTDTGEGMSEDTLKHIFSPFFTTKPPHEGTGLGLTMISNIIRNHNGKIFCESQLGVGTVFTLYLPLIQV